MGSRQGSGVKFAAKGASGDTAHAETVAQAYMRMIDGSIAATSLEVYKDGANPALTIGIRPGAYFNGNTLVTRSEETGFALDDDATVYVYLTANGTTTKSTTGWPQVPHLRLAVVLTGSASAAAASGSFAVLDITDHRMSAMFSVAAPSPGNSAFEIREDFAGDVGDTLPTPWKTDQLATGTGDYIADLAGGVYGLGLTVANAAEASQLTFGDQLLIDTDNNPVLEFRVRVDNVAAMTSVERIAIGLVKVHANSEDALDNIDHSVWFLIKGPADLNIYQEADDGSADTNDQDTGIDIVDDTWTVFRIDMSDLTAVAMSVDGAATVATLDMTQSAGEVLQPIVVIQRDDNSQTEAAVEVELDLAHVQVDR